MSIEICVLISYNLVVNMNAKNEPFFFLFESEVEALRNQLCIVMGQWYSD